MVAMTNNNRLPQDNEAWKADFMALRPMPDGTHIGLQKQLFTWGLFAGVTEWGWRTRFCYEHFNDALNAFATWEGTSDPPGPWVKQKPEERLGPGALK